MKKCRVPLDDEELDTILVIARNSQSGRITEYEIKKGPLLHQLPDHPSAETDDHRCKQPEGNLPNMVPAHGLSPRSKAVRKSARLSALA